MKYLGFILSIFCVMQSVNAQERLTTLSSNPLLKIETPSYSLKKQVINLPFADDFNQTSYFPENSRWTDNDVFVNNTYPINPPTIGVATFDGLNSSAATVILPRDAF